jgi:hypothetical protein
MASNSPLEKPKAAFADLIRQISLSDSPVGIDAQYTHAIIIDFLRQISARLDQIEQQLKTGGG